MHSGGVQTRSIEYHSIRTILAYYIHRMEGLDQSDNPLMMPTLKMSRQQQKVEQNNSYHTHDERHVHR